MKVCGSCRERKDASAFYAHDPHRCKVCRNKQHKAWRQTPGGRATKRAGVLRREFGITPQQYEAMHAAQNGLCAVCQKPETKVTTGTCRLAVDHDHETGKVRGLLCANCNVGIGCFFDDPALLEAAAAYLGAAHGRVTDLEAELARTKHLG